MTKLVIISDSHNNHAMVERVLAAEKKANALIYLGDGLADMERALMFHPRMRVYAVAGNCDFGALEPQDGLAAFDKVIVYYTHGHNHGVKYSLDRIAAHGKARGAELVLFGHTHIPVSEVVDGVHLFNPGSYGRSHNGCNTYGVITLHEGQIVSAEHKPVPLV